MISGVNLVGSAFRRVALALGALALLAFVSSASAAPMSLMPPQVVKAQPKPAPAVAPTLPNAQPVVTPVVARPEQPVVVPQAVTPAAVAPVLAKPDVVKKHYNVVVLGDSLGDGVWAGLYHALRKDKRFNVIRKSKVATGFVRQDYYNWNDSVHEVAADTTIDIAVVIMGTNDRQTIIEDGARYALFTPKWREIYSSRVDDFTATLQATGAHIYWAGLPVMRGQVFESDMVEFTKLFKERAASNDVTFVPTHSLMTDSNGDYAAYGLDAKGRKSLLRAEDGIHFTMEGYEQLVQPIVAAIKRDVDGGIVTADASAMAVSAAASEANSNSDIASPKAIGLKAQIYDVAEGRPGRSDDWRWTGAAR